MLDRPEISLLARTGAVLLGTVPIAQALYFFVIHLVDVPHSRGGFIAAMIVVWLVPLGLFVAARWSLPKPTAADFAFAALICVLLAHLLFVSKSAGVQDYVQLAIFVAGPYAAARLLPADVARSFLVSLAVSCVVIMAYTLASFVNAAASGNSMLRPTLLGINHGVHLVGLALLFLVLHAVVRLPNEANTARRALLGIAGLTAFSLLLLLSSRGMASIAFLVCAIAVVAIPGRAALVRGVFLVGMVVSAATVFSSNVEVRQFMALAVPDGAALGAVVGYGAGEMPSPEELVIGEDVDGRFQVQTCDALMNSNNSTSIRLALYERAVDLFLANPLLGVGLRDYASHFCPGSFPHSTLLQAAAELGIVGLSIAIAVVAIVFTGLVRLGWAERHRGGAEAVALAVLLAGVLGVDQLYGELLLMTPTAIFLGAAAAWIAQSKRTTPAGTTPA